MFEPDRAREILAKFERLVAKWRKQSRNSIEKSSMRSLAR